MSSSGVEPLEEVLKGIDRQELPDEELVEVLFDDFMRRIELGEEVRPELYFEQFPHVQETLDRYFEVRHVLDECLTPEISGASSASPLAGAISALWTGTPRGTLSSRDSSRKDHESHVIRRRSRILNI